MAYLGLLRQNRWTEKVLSGPKSCSSIPSRQWMCQNVRPRSTRENPQLVGNASNEKVKPISLTLQNKLKGFTFKIVLFDNSCSTDLCHGCSSLQFDCHYFGALGFCVAVSSLHTHFTMTVETLKPAKAISVSQQK